MEFVAIGVNVVLKIDLNLRCHLLADIETEEASDDASDAKR